MSDGQTEMDGRTDGRLSYTALHGIC